MVYLRVVFMSVAADTKTALVSMVIAAKTGTTGSGGPLGILEAAHPLGRVAPLPPDCLPDFVLPEECPHVPAIRDRLLRIGEGKILRQLEAIAKAVNAIEDDFVKMSDTELQGMTAEFKQRLSDGETLDDLMPEAFAAVREAAKRVIGQRHYD